MSCVATTLGVCSASGSPASVVASTFVPSVEPASSLMAAAFAQSSFGGAGVETWMSSVKSKFGFVGVSFDITWT